MIFLHFTKSACAWWKCTVRLRMWKKKKRFLVWKQVEPKAFRYDALLNSVDVLCIYFPICKLNKIIYMLRDFYSYLTWNSIYSRVGVFINSITRPFRHYLKNTSSSFQVNEGKENFSLVKLKLLHILQDNYLILKRIHLIFAMKFFLMPNRIKNKQFRRFFKKHFIIMVA